MVAEPAGVDRILTAVAVADEPDTRRLIRMLALGAGVEIVGETHTSIEAVLLVARHHPDIVLIDEPSPGGDAAQTVRALRATRPGIFVIGLGTGPGRASPGWANARLDRTKIHDLPLVLGAARRMLAQEQRLLEVGAKLDASRGVLEIVRQRWGSVDHERTGKLIDELADGFERLSSGLDSVHEAMRGDASLIQVVDSLPVTIPDRGMRPKLNEVRVDHVRDEVSAQVILEAGDQHLVGRSSRRVGDRPAYPPVAEAVLDAASDLLEDDIDVRDFDVIRVGDASLAVVIFERGDNTLVGSARVRGEVAEAVARASLDGLNRSMTRPSTPRVIRL